MVNVPLEKAMAGAKWISEGLERCELPSVGLKDSLRRLGANFAMIRYCLVCRVPDIREATLGQ